MLKQCCDKALAVRLVRPEADFRRRATAHIGKSMSRQPRKAGVGIQNFTVQGGEQNGIRAVAEGLAEFLLTLTQHLLRTFALRHVLKRSRTEHHPASLVFEHRDIRQTGKDGAVFPQMHRLVNVAAFVLHGLDMLWHRRPRLGCEHFGQMHPDHLRHLITVHPCKGGIHMRQHVGLRISDGHAPAGLAEDGLVALDGRIRLPPRRDVLRKDDDAGFAVGSGKRIGVTLLHRTRQATLVNFDPAWRQIRKDLVVTAPDQRDIPQVVILPPTLADHQIPHVTVQHGDGRRNMLHIEPQLLLPLLQSMLRLHAFAQVIDEADAVPRLAFDQGYRHQDRNTAAI